MIEKARIIRDIALHHPEVLPPSSHRILSNLDTMEPGMDGMAIKYISECVDVRPDQGIFVILSGPIGCGKTIAAYVGAILYEWETHLRAHFERMFDSLRDGDNYAFLEAANLREIDTPEGTDEEKAYQLIYAIYTQSHRNCPSFILLRAYDILKDAIKTDSRIIAATKKLVVIDDLGREYFTSKGFGIAEWDAFFDTRYSHQLPTIITTNLTPEEFIEKYNRRIYDRLRETAEWITITGGSMRKRRNDS